MKKAILLLCIASALCGKSVAQSVVSSAGSSTDMLTWTLGEVFTESVMRSYSHIDLGYPEYQGR